MFLKIFPPAFHVYIFTYSCILMMLMHIKVRCVVCFHLFYFSFRYFIVSLVTSLHFVYFPKKKEKKRTIYSYASFCFILFIWSKPWLMVAGRLESQTILSVLGNYFFFFFLYYYYYYYYYYPGAESLGSLAPQNFSNFH